MRSMAKIMVYSCENGLHTLHLLLSYRNQSNNPQNTEQSVKHHKISSACTRDGQYQMSCGGDCPGDCCSVIRQILARDTGTPLRQLVALIVTSLLTLSTMGTIHIIWHYILVKNEENTVLVFILILHYFVENFTAIQPNKCRCLPTVYIKSFKIMNEAYVKSKICMYISKKSSQFSVTLPKCWTTNTKFATRWFWWCRQSIEGGQLQMALPTTRGKMESIQSDMK